MFHRTLKLGNAPWRTIAEYSLLVLLGGAILWHGGKTLEVTWIFVGVAWLLVISQDTSSRAKGVSPVVWVMILLYLLFTVLSYLGSSVQNYGLDEVFRAVALSLTFLWASRLPEDAPIKRRFLFVLLLTALLACVVGLVIYVFQPVSRFVGTFFDHRFTTDYWPNAWAEFLLLAWPVAALLSFTGAEKRGDVPLKFLRVLLVSLPVGIVVGCLFLSFSRAAFIAFLGQLLILLLWRGILASPWSFKRTVTVFCCILGFAVLVFAGGNILRSQRYNVQSVSDKALFKSDEGTTSITEREDFWEEAALLADERPLLGWGPGSFRFVQPRLSLSVLATSDHAHNVFLKIAMDRGWPAALLLLGMACLVLASIFSASGALHDGNPIREREYFFLFLSAAGVIAHNLVDYNLQFVGIVLPLSVILGMLAGNHVRWRNLNNKFVHVVESAVISLLLFVALRESFFVITSSLGRRALARGDTAAASKWFSRSEGEWYSRDLLLTEGRVLFDGKQYEAAMEKAKAYSLINAYDYRGWELQGQIAAAKEQDALSLEAYEKAYALGGMVDIGTLRGVLEGLLNTQGREAVLLRKPEIDVMIRKYYDAILKNTHFIALSGNVEEFLKTTEIMSDLSPADEPKYQVMAAAVARQSKLERQKVLQMPKGAFW